MRWISLEELKQLANGKEVVYVLESLLLNDSISVYDERTGKQWFIYDYDSLVDGVDIIEEWLREIEEDKLILEYYYRWSLSQYSFTNDRLHQTKVRVYLTDKGYRVEKYYDDGTYEQEIIPNERKLLEKMAWHGYGRVLYFTYISDDLPKQVIEWIQERRSWAKILTKV